MECSHCFNTYFHWCVETRQWKMQGFWTKSSKTLHMNKASWPCKLRLSRLVALFSTHYNKNLIMMWRGP